MNETNTARSVLLKAARIALVFALVFYTSLRVELLVAYGADALDTVTADDGKDHDEGELVDLLLYQLTENDKGEPRWVPVKNGAASSDDEAAIELSTADAALQFVVAPVWGEKGSDEYKETLKKFNDGDAIKKVESATFVKWDEPSADSVTQSIAEKKNVATLTPAAAGKATVKCAVDSEKRDEKLSLSLKVTVTEPEPVIPEIESVEILDPSDPTGSSTSITYAKGDLPVKDQQLQARVTVGNQTFSDSGVYEFPKDGSLAEWSGGAISDLEWSIEPAEGAAVTADGVLSVTDEGDYMVTCRAQVVGGDPKSGSLPVYVRDSGEPEPDNPGGDDSKDDSKGDSKDDSADDPQPQDEPHPRESLHIESTVEFLKADTSESNEIGTAKVDKTYSASELGERSASAEQQEFTMYVGGAETKITGQGVALRDLLDEAFGEAGVDLETAPVDSVEFIDYAGKSTTIPFNTVKDTPMLVALKSAARGAGDGGTAAVDGSTGESSDGANGSDGASASSESSESSEAGEKSEASSSTGATESTESSSATEDATVLEDTPFRILFDSSKQDFDANDLRWIETIRLNGEAQSEDENEVDVYIDYTKVPMGVDTQLVAVPTSKITGSWTFKWFVKEKGTSRWDGDKYASEEGQTLTVPTTEATVGNQYMVQIINTVPDGEQPKHGMSKPITLQALGADEWSVVLSYIPPEAGNMAIFKANIYQYKGDVSQLRYTWRWSNDGGANWGSTETQDGVFSSAAYSDDHILGAAKSTDATKKIPTSDPSSSESSSDSSGPLYYFKVNVSTVSQDDYVNRAPASGWPNESNVQPLTVRSYDEDSGPKSGGDANNTDANQAKAEESRQSSRKSSDERVNEVNINFDNGAIPDSSDSGGDPSELYISDAVSERIAAQEEAEAEEMAANTPGARWTQLKTLEPDSDEVSRVLADNPFVPFAIPMGLGVTVAGGLEKLLSFRRQL